MIRCERCGAEWNPPKKSSKSQSECPFCGAVLLEEAKARGYGKMEEFLGYMVKVYGAEIYRSPERLKNLLGDLYGGEEREKRLYRRVLMEERLSEKVYGIARKPKAERQAYYNREASQFAEGNYYPEEVGRKVVGSLVFGLTGEVLWAGDAASGDTAGGTAQAVVLPESRNRTIRVGDVQFEMVYVEGGMFRMGATEEQGEDAWDWEAPVHRVSLSSYLIGKHEVTQGLWSEVMGENPSRNKAGDNYPVENVSWEDCQGFIERLNNRTGLDFRLPMEAEWEYAARGGVKSKGYKYAGSDGLDEVGWYRDNSGGHTHPVGQKKPNELGLHDMSGNVWEWCQDWYGGYEDEAQTNPTGPQSGGARVLRGGSRWCYARRCRVSCRYLNFPGSRNAHCGLRLALSL